MMTTERRERWIKALKNKSQFFENNGNAFVVSMKKKL